MKKALILAITAVAALAGTQAMAVNFTAGDFVREVSNGTAERGWDLVDLGAASLAGVYTGATPSPTLTTGDNLSFWSYDATTKTGYISNTSNTLTAAALATSGVASVGGGTSNTYTKYASGAANYFSLTNGVGQTAYTDYLRVSFGGMVPTGFEASLASIGTGSVTEYLYKYTIGGSARAPTITLTGNGPDYVAVTALVGGNLQTTISANAPVPLPGAVVLLGSGLAGLLGIRRKVS